jgi:tetratricopeptide (TPR) repeat protein
MLDKVRPAGSTHPAGRAPWVHRAVATGVVLALTAVIGGLWRFERGMKSAPAAAPNVVASEASSSELEALQRRLRSDPRDAAGWAALGAAYTQQARVTGDPTWYPKAEQVLRRSLDLDASRNVAAMTAMGALAAARHEFEQALGWANKAIAVDARDAAALGVKGDALVELGKYVQGFTAFQQMVDVRPALPSYARASYAWELQGNVSNALRAFELGLGAASSANEAAFAHYYLGELYWNSGRIAEADEHYRRSAAVDPAFVPAVQGSAKVAAARGDLAEAARKYELVVARLPLPQYLTELADIYTADGKPSLARRQFDVLRIQEQLLQANGVNVDVDQVLYKADHMLDPHSALVAARAEWNKRRSIFVADALAWALHANGKDGEALRYSNEALKLGTRNALFYFHRGVIRQALGRHDDARRDLTTALDINPHFSFLWAKRASEMLRSLR